MRPATNSQHDLYIADSWNNMVWKLDGKCAISLLAGNGEKSSKDDGGLATAASVNAPIDLAIRKTPQASYLLIAELEGSRVRSIRIR
jgi:hypothetical protein